MEAPVKGAWKYRHKFSVNDCSALLLGCIIPEKTDGRLSELQSQAG
jgi:hypothetical protein